MKTNILKNVLIVTGITAMMMLAFMIAIFYRPSDFMAGTITGICTIIALAILRRTNGK